MRSEYLTYFKDLIEGRAEISWNAWFEANEAALSQDLPRMAYLRLKFKKIDEAEQVLRAAGIAYSPSPLLRREKYYALLHPSVLDDKGRPKPEFRRKAYSGAYGLFEDGNLNDARDKFAGYLKKISRYPITRRAEELESFCFDGEMEFLHGERELGRMMLEGVAELPIGDDLLDPAIFGAREMLGLPQR